MGQGWHPLLGEGSQVKADLTKDVAQHTIISLLSVLPTHPAGIMMRRLETQPVGTWKGPFFIKL